MSLIDYFRSPPTMSADDIREFIKGRSAEEINILDVRQPGEYEGGHLPGASLLPVAELESRIGELDPDKPTITY